ncbi:hypothetical protein NN561_020312 [Cricetulus griseus]
MPAQSTSGLISETAPAALRPQVFSVPQRLREHRRESRVRNARLPASCALPNPSVCGGHLGRKPRFCFHRDSFTAPETHTSCRCPGLPVHPRDSAAQQQGSARDRHPETVSAETWAGEEKIPSFR